MAKVSAKILIKSDIAKITDFGLSSVVKQVMSTSKGDGTVAYKDPLCFKGDPYRRGKKSDIFSLGVIFWEISSGKIPCEGRVEIHAIVMYRLNGFRDEPVLGTPEKY